MTCFPDDQHNLPVGLAALFKMLAIDPKFLKGKTRLKHNVS